MPNQDTRDPEQRIRHVYAGYREQGSATRWSMANPGYRRLVEERRAAEADALQRLGLLPLGGRSILDVGCGGGDELARLEELGAEPRLMHGIDLLPDRIAVAREAHPGIDFRTANAERLDFDDAAFDLILCFTVFSSILDDGMADRVAREMRRVLRRGGAILWYDLRYRNPANRNVRGLSRRDVTNLFPDLTPDLRTVGLLPPLARQLGPATPVAYPALRLIPALRSHLIGGLVKVR